MLRILRAIRGPPKPSGDKLTDHKDSGYTPLQKDRQYPGEGLPETVSLVREGKLGTEADYEPVGQTKCNGYAKPLSNGHAKLGDSPHSNGYQGTVAEPLYAKIDKSYKTARGNADGSEMTADQLYTDILLPDTRVSDEEQKNGLSSFRAPESVPHEDTAVSRPQKPPRLSLNIEGGDEAEPGTDDVSFDDLLAELDNTCQELDQQLTKAQEKQQQPEAPVLPEPQLHLEPEVIVKDTRGEETPAPGLFVLSQSCPDLGSIRLRNNGKKTVTFNENVEKFERPASFLEQLDSSGYPGMAPFPVPVPVPGDSERKELFLTVPAPIQIRPPQPHTARHMWHDDDDDGSTQSDDVTVQKRRYFAAIASPIKDSRSEIVPIKLNGNGKANGKTPLPDVDVITQEDDDDVFKQKLPPDDPLADNLSISSDKHLVETLKPGLKVRTLPKTKTAIILLSVLLMALCCEITDLLLHALAYHVDSSYEVVSRSFAARCVGILLGAILTSFHDNRCLGLAVMGVAMVVVGGCSFALPWCQRGVYLLLGACGRGLGQGMFLISALLQLVDSWTEDRLPLCIHVMLLLMALGGALACQLTRPFLTDSFHFLGVVPYLRSTGVWELVYAESNNVMPTSHTIEISNGTLAEMLVAMNSENVGDNGDTYSRDDVPAIVVPLVMLGGLCLVFGICFFLLLAYHYLQLYRKRKRDEENREIHHRIMKEQIQIVQSLDSQSYAAEPSSTDSSVKKTGSEGEQDEGSESSSDRKPLLLSPGPCALEEQIAKLNELAKEHIKQHGSLPESVQQSLKLAQAMPPSPIKRVTIKAPKEKVRWFQYRHQLDVPLLLYLYVYFTFAFGMEVIYSRFLYVFAAKCPLHLGLFEGSLLMTAFWGCLFLGRLLAIPVSRVLTPNAMMIICLTFNLISPIIIFIYGQRFQSILWLFSSLVGLTLGPILPGGLTWANIYLTSAPKTLALALCFAAFGGALFSWLAGFVLDYFGYTALMYLATAIAGLGLLLYIPIMGVMGKGHWYRLKRKQVPQPKHIVQVSYV